MDLRRLFDPRKVAVIGASGRPGQVGTEVVRSLLRAGRQVLPVHQKAQEVLGLPVLDHIDKLPGDVDLAVLALPAQPSWQSAVAAAHRGIPFLIPLASGFSESGAEGLRLQQEMVKQVRLAGSRLLGPNTLGLWVPGKGPDTLFVDHETELLKNPGCVAFCSQSGSVGVEALGAAAPFGYGLRCFVSLGNRADLDECDFLEHFRSDPGCRCVALYLESFADGRRFLQVASQIALEKPVLVLKAGRTPGGAHAGLSHTGSLGGSHNVAQGAFTQFGILSASDDEALLDGAKALALSPPAQGPRLAILTPAGGYGVMAADEAESDGDSLQLATLCKATKVRLHADTLPYATIANPMDLTASATDAMMESALRALLSDPGVDLALCAFFLGPPGMSIGFSDRLAAVVRDISKPVVVLAMHGQETASLCRRLTDAGVAAFPSLHRAMGAVRLLVRRGQWLEKKRKDS